MRREACLGGGWDGFSEPRTGATEKQIKFRRAGGAALKRQTLATSSISITCQGRRCAKAWKRRGKAGSKQSTFACPAVLPLPFQRYSCNGRRTSDARRSCRCDGTHAADHDPGPGLMSTEESTLPTRPMGDAGSRSGHAVHMLSRSWRCAVHVRSGVCEATQARQHDGSPGLGGESLAAKQGKAACRSMGDWRLARSPHGEVGALASARQSEVTVRL